MKLAAKIVDPWMNGDPCEDCRTCEKVCTKLTERIEAEISTAFTDIDEMCQMGLNSSNPVHWEAALQDILEFVRNRCAASQ